MSLINKAYAIGKSRGTSLATGYYIAPNGRSIFCQNPNSEGGVHIWGGKTYYEDKVNPQWIPFDMSWALENQDKLFLLLSPTEATTQIYLESVETYISSPKATVLVGVDPSENLKNYIGKVVAWVDPQLQDVSFVTSEVAEELKAFFQKDSYDPAFPYPEIILVDDDPNPINDEPSDWNWDDPSGAWFHCS